MEPDTRTGRLAQHFRTRAADVRSQLLQRHGLPDDAPLAAAFVAPLRSCCPPQEGLREVAREEAETAARQRHPPAARQPQPVPVAPVVDASLGTPARIAVGVAVTGVAAPGVAGAAPGAPAVGPPFPVATQPLPRVATSTVAGHAHALPAPPQVPRVNTGGEGSREDRAAGAPASAALVVPDTPQTPFSDGDTPMSGSGGAGVEAAEVDSMLVEAMAADAERQATLARASSSHALALKAASKILADRRKPRQAGIA